MVSDPTGVRILQMGERTFLAEVGSLAEVLALRAALAAAPIEGIGDLVPAARTVLVPFEPARVPAATVRSWIVRAWTGRAGSEDRGRDADASTAPATARSIDLDIAYDGPDLAETAELLGLGPGELAERHARAEWTVAFTGFAPGFGYLTSASWTFDVPRLDSPRTRVPAGSVGLAGAFSGAYPRETPGGWRLIGTTSAPLFEPAAESPALLIPGDRVRFRRVSTRKAAVTGAASTRTAAAMGTAGSDAVVPSGRASEASVPPSVPLPSAPSGPPLSAPLVPRPSSPSVTPLVPRPSSPSSARPVPPLSSPSPARPVSRPSAPPIAGPGAPSPARPSPPPGPQPAAIEVLEPGLFASVQDLGRPGHASIGVARSGALDRDGLRIANRLVGNPEGSAAVEVAMGGFRAVAERDLWVAVTGGFGPASMDGRPVDMYEAHAWPRGSELRIGWLEHGARAYLAVRGGIAAVHVADVGHSAAVLGSLSTDTLARLAPLPLRPGARLVVGPSPQTPVPPLDVAPWGPPPDEVALELAPGPRADWFEASASSLLFDAVWTVSGDADRVGVRLEGPELVRTTVGELPSEGMVPGALQVPPGGRPTVLLADGPVTGGYPVIAVVTDASLDALGQARPGTRIRFRHARA